MNNPESKKGEGNGKYNQFRQEDFIPAEMDFYVSR